MTATSQAQINVEEYLDRRTLIMGAVNSGKTRYTQNIVRALYEAGHGTQIIIIDIAPEPIKGIGGKMGHQGMDEIILLTCPIVAPRLTGKNSDHVQQLAQQNALAIEPLLDRAMDARRSIIVFNDASLYLQAGHPERLITVIKTFSTVVINAYYGHNFKPAPFTDYERSGVEALAEACDKVIEL